MTTTQAFDDIRFFSIDRSNDIVSFVGTKNGKSTLYPSGTPVENLEEIEDIRTVNGILYIILKNGIVTQDGNIIGTIFREHSQSEFLMIMDFDNKLRIYSNKHSFVFPVEQENIHHVYIDTGTNNVYWRADTTNGQAVFKNGKQLSGEYPSILRYAISAEGDIMYITENETRDAKFVLKNGVVIHTIHDEYIRGSLQMNGTDVIYLILNPDDSTISVVVNGAILEQKFDTVSHVFLSDNSSSYLYFAQLPNEDKFCVFGRYNGSVCELDAYMNPAVEGDGK